MKINTLKQNKGILIYLGNILFFILSIPCDAQNKMHPKIEVRDSMGSIIRSANSSISISKTCNNCHDASSIEHKSTHSMDKVKVNCLQCHLGTDHFEFSHIDKSGFLKEEVSRSISRPLNKYCASCHGLSHESKTPLEIDSKKYAFENNQSWALKKASFFSAQSPLESSLNLENKTQLTEAWDIHAQRQVRCIDCHFSSNNPRKENLNQNSKDNLEHLRFDPRSLNTSDYLKSPNHNLKTAQCTSCHDPNPIHQNLPFKERHFKNLTCQSCHTATIRTPSAEIINSALLSSDLTPLVQYKNIVTDELNSVNLNTSYIKEIHPNYFRNSENKFVPYNLIQNYIWVDDSGKEITSEVVQSVFKELYKNKNGDFYKLFDTDKNQEISISELQTLDLIKIDFLKAEFEKKLSKKLSIMSKIELNKISHGIQRGKMVLSDCQSCHSEKSILLSSNQTYVGLPRGIQWNQDPITQFVLNINKNKDDHKNSYIIGSVNGNWPDQVGIILVLSTIIGILLHSILRYLNRHKNQPETIGLKKVYMYTSYERLWHWINAFGITLLLITGIELHFGGKVEVFGFKGSILIHNVFASVLILNGFLSLFYHLASKEIKQFLPPISGFSEAAIKQIQYYLFGIFKGHHHPLEKSPEAKLNPLQQITYLFLLNLMIPLQIFSGTLIWLTEIYPHWNYQIFNLGLVSSIHILGNWMLLQFLILHIYLTTTGRTLTSNIQAMIVGYEEVGDAHAKN